MSLLAPRCVFAVAAAVLEFKTRTSLRKIRQSRERVDISQGLYRQARIGVGYSEGVRNAAEIFAGDLPPKVEDGFCSEMTPEHGRRP